ncbi:MAG: hypothetical protein Phog2KO_46960 [Phototrophicaceae bacterium]
MRKYLLIGLLLLFCVQITAQDIPPLSTCTEGQINDANNILGDYTPSEMQGFVRMEDSQLMLGSEPYAVRGINYYPSQYPWRRFLSESDPETIQQDLAVMREANLNTLRIFVWNQAIFQCYGSGAVPNAYNFQRLDNMIQLAGNMGFRLIVTLNDLPDLINRPLYDNPAHVVAQTAFIVSRYRDEPAILAWDVRNEGDIDYGTHPNLRGDFEREAVLSWLEDTTQMVRAIDSNHLITAGWLYDAESTAPYVDFISFHHWTGADELVERINAMQAVTDTPILLQEVGYATFMRSEEDQAIILADVLETAENTNLLGWLIWTAFDFPREATCYPSPCQSVNNQEHYFGLWNSDYSPKLAVAIIRFC